jgi:hypothetical protein
MKEPHKLPPEVERVAEILSTQPPQVREVFRFALVLMMRDDEKARIVSRRTVDGREYLAIVTIAGDEFEIVRPEISADLEQQLREQVRAIMDQDANQSETTD